jgi:1,4-dihydroxy-2-naphthoyl-CoA synthase
MEQMKWVWKKVTERLILFYTTYALEDQKEGMQTFIEKLEPDFANTQWLVVVKIYDNS